MFGVTFMTGVKRNLALFKDKAEKSKRGSAELGASLKKRKRHNNRPFELQRLAQYSYIISSQDRSVVIDPIFGIQPAICIS